jgi:hypothetical protein
MTDFTGIDAHHAVINFWGAHAATLPEHVRTKFAEVMGGQGMLDRIIGAMEALYAARASLNEDGVELLGGLARFVSANDFHGKALRAGSMSGVASRIKNGGDAEKTGDVEIDAMFVEAEETGEIVTEETGEIVTEETETPIEG